MAKKKMKTSVKVMLIISIILSVLAVLSGTILACVSCTIFTIELEGLTALGAGYLWLIGLGGIVICLGMVAVIWAVYGIALLVKKLKHKNDIQSGAE